LNAILELVKEGLGYAVLPAYTLSNFAKPEDFTTHRIEKPKLMSQLMLVWSARRPMTATHKAAMQLTQDVVSQALAAVKVHQLSSLPPPESALSQSLPEPTSNEPTSGWAGASKGT
jgi:LysR family nitrogen assimilation transcriptional regulator